jgi:hypothetical protein
MNEPEECFYPYARLFARESLAVGASPVFYMTWSRKADLPAQEVLTRAYAAWERVRRERPELELYGEDGHHPGPAGTYLAACVFYASLFHQPCLGAPSTLSGAPWTGAAFDTTRTETLVELPEDTARYLQQVGSEVGLSTGLPERPSSTAPRLVFPQLPRGAPLDAAKVAGTWQGSLALYPAELGMAPVPMWLSVEPQGTRLTGQVRILFPRDAPLAGDVAPRVDGEELVFSLDDAGLLGATLHFRAVSAEGGLRGVAHAQDAQGGRWFGSWSARPSSPA